MQFLEISLFVISVIILSAYAIYRLAQADIFWTTDPPEGTAKAIVRGATTSESGSFVRFICSYAGYYLDLEHEVVRGAPDRRFPLFAWLGVYWVGLYPFNTILEYPFNWTELVQDEEGIYRSLHRTGLTKLIFLKKVQYVITLKAAETLGQIPATLKIVLTLRITNPYKAIFKTDDWLTRISSATIGLARLYVGGRAYEELVNEGTAGSGAGDKPFAKIILELNDSLDAAGLDFGNGLKNVYGVTLLDAEIQDVEIEGGEELREATVAEKVATEKAKAEVARAEGEARAITIVATARAREVTEVTSAVTTQGENGQLFLTTEALKRASEGEGNTVVWAGGIRGLISNLLGG